MRIINSSTVLVKQKKSFCYRFRGLCLSINSLQQVLRYMIPVVISFNPASYAYHSRA